MVIRALVLHTIHSLPTKSVDLTLSFRFPKQSKRKAIEVKTKMNQPKSPESTDWLSGADQLVWFNKFSGDSAEGTKETPGIKFNHFQEFLKATIYDYLASLPIEGAGTGTGDRTTASVVKFTCQQEMQLFKMFDTKNDHVMDTEEFKSMCQDWLSKTFRKSCALVIVDVQNDFIDGSLALINGPAGEDGAEVVPVINSMLDRHNFDAVVYTQDWHPSDHIGFHNNLHLRKYTLKRDNRAANSVALASQADTTDPEAAKNGQTFDSSDVGTGRHRGFKIKRLVTDAKLFDTVLFDEGRMEQKLWPTHCVQNSWGAELHPKLKVMPDSIRVLKGTLSHVDAYSAFWDNMRLNETTLRQELTSRGITDVFFCGLALDYCVAASAMDSVRGGFVTFIIEDACRGIDRGEIERRKKELVENGVLLVNSVTINNYFLQPDSGRANDLTRTGHNINGSAGLAPTSNSCGMVDRMFLLDACFKRALNLAR